jgi:hypothetical protein
LARAANLWTLLGLAAVAITLGVRSGRKPGKSLKELRHPVYVAVFGIYGVLYAVHALAPEIRPDGYTYHLALPAEWLRLGGFSGRIGFFEMLPQGLEMLFMFAFAVGRHSAAKLVHFVFLAASVPLIFSIARRLRIPEWGAGAAAILYFCSPVAGTSGTSAYNDAALVFFILATFYLILAWMEDRRDFYLVLAGLTAGFCYSIKFTGLIVAPMVITVALLHRRWRLAGLTAFAAALMVVPWLSRNALWTGNPFAPLFNGLFPNPYFHVQTEQTLAESLRSYPGVTWMSMPLEVTVWGQRLQGLVGPAFLLSPVALWALRRREGRILVAAAILMAIPWFFNNGARFIMPSLVFIALALVLVLPRKVALACAAAQALLCLPFMVRLYADAGAWSLEGFPWRAALRVEAEEDYLRRQLWEYHLVELVNKHVPAGERVLDLVGAPTAYIDATVISDWQSASGDRMTHALQMAAESRPGAFRAIEGRWPEQPLTGVRLVNTGVSDGQWGISEIRLFRGAERVAREPQWRPIGKPNSWDAKFVFDDNLISRWGTWQAARPGMHAGIEFNEPVRLSGASAICFSGEQGGPVFYEGREAGGEWRPLAKLPEGTPLPALNLRRSSTRLLKQEGVRFILEATRNRPYNRIGRLLKEHPKEWDVELVAELGGVHLFRLL